MVKVIKCGGDVEMKRMKAKSLNSSTGHETKSLNLGGGVTAPVQVHFTGNAGTGSGEMLRC